MPSSTPWPHTSPGSGTSSSQSSHNSDSGSSYRTQNTAATEYSDMDCRPTFPRHGTCDPKIEGWHQYYAEPMYHEDPKASVDTYASTTASEDDFSDENYSVYDEPAYQGHEVVGSDAIPSTPRDFAAHFPSTRRLDISHDDATLDGNMNLRIDTKVDARGGYKRPLTLFHLRMNDLKRREFALNRYYRDSGREVCHSVRKYQKPVAERRPTLQKSLSNALSTLRLGPHPQKSQATSLNRSDSGYASNFPDDEAKRSQDPASGNSKRAALMPTNTIKLEFSNYAHVDVKRRGAGSSKRYEFEYWGVDYAWRRRVQRDGDFEEVSFHLHRADHEGSLAHIVPVPLSTRDQAEERAKGGWVPPCSMWITDETIISELSDLSDLVVATGLMALVDDCIKRRWHSKRGVQLPIPLSRSSSFRMNLNYVGPKRLIDEVFNRGLRRPTVSRKPTKVRFD